VALAVPELDDGSYLVAWETAGGERSGAFSFRVDRSGRGAVSALGRVVRSDGSDTVARGLATATRFLSSAGVLLLVGTVAMVSIWWPVAIGHGAIRRIVWGTWAVAMVTSFVGFTVDGIRGTDLGLSGLTDVALWGDVVDTRAGLAWLARGLLLGVVAPLLLWVTNSGAGAARSWGFRLAGLGAALGLFATLAVDGHAVEGDRAAVGFTVSMIHLSSLSALAGTLVLGVHGGRTDTPGPEGLTRRLTGTALAAAVLVLSSGLAEGWRQTGSGPALTDTGYGQLLIAKGAAVALLGGLAWAGRRSWTSGRRGRALLAGGLFAVLLSALLAGLAPGRTEVEATTALREDLEDGFFDLTVAPARSGSNELHLYLFDETGSPATIDEADLSLNHPDTGIGPLTAPLLRAGPNHFLVYDLTLPFAGTWDLRVDAVAADGARLDVATTLDLQ
jgi:copper transport protein